MVEKIKRSLPHLGAILAFVILSFAYFSPVLEGKHLPQMDENHAIGMAKELKDYEKDTGERAMWTNSMFSGMPAYQIKGDASKNVFSHINRVSRLGLPYKTVGILFLYLLGFYVLLLSLRVNHWMSVAGAIAFAFGSYNLIIIIAGHITKAYAIALMGPVIAAIIYAYNQNRWVGGLFTALALGLEIAYNHVQITYYLAILVMVLVIAKLIEAIKEKALPAFAKTSGVLVTAALLALLPNITNLWTTYEYGKISIRGKSELTTPQGEKEHSGLDKDYAFAWSYGQKETFTLMVPNVVGGASEALGNAPETLKDVDSRMKEYVAQQSQYWGGRPFTSGPVYAGAIICFLFFLGIFYYKGKERWWLIAGTILSILLAWGKNLGGFNDFMFYYFPMYNKFRTVEMALVIASFTMPVLGFLGLKTIFEKPELIKNNSKWFLIAFVLTGGVSLLLYLAPSVFFNFISDQEASAFAMQSQKSSDMAMMMSMLEQGLVSARISLLKADALRSFLFIALASGSIWFYATKKLAGKYLLGGLILLILIDLWGVDKRYLNNDNFVGKSKANKEFAMSKADKFIKKDRDKYYRVFSIYRNPFTEVATSYHHKSIGGYHGAKLRRYQDVIDRYLQPNWQTLMGALQQGAAAGQLEEVMEGMPVLNMLNTKYVIYNPNANAIFNPAYMGNAWFVKQIREVVNADEEIAAIGKTDLHRVAVVDKQFAIGIDNYQVDSITGRIELTQYMPDKLMYSTNNTQDQLAVFSDVYYAKGWNAYIDGVSVDHIHVNYILRGLMVPAGEHVVEFRFEPKSFTYGQIIAIISSILLVILLAVFGAWKWRQVK
ncbi:hypothetical protein DMA11_15740 [Marinilabiliaceae bacterium JC017]|nr:hypothetical protein DMA11_15740 [Marinilabiliaceae bacterium JC017]